MAQMKMEQVFIQVSAPLSLQGTCRSREAVRNLHGQSLPEHRKQEKGDMEGGNKRGSLFLGEEEQQSRRTWA